MTGRSVDEWIGRTPDEAVPARVRLRVLRRFDDRCACCTRPLPPGTRFTCDHVVALINGGANRESNLQPLCDWCNPKKNAADVADKSKVADMAKAIYGLKKPKGRPMNGSRNSPWRKRVSGRTERRMI
jgi:hypothetical protein